MSDTATVTTQEETKERTFTQEELNAIVGKRVAEERGKYSDYEALKEKATQLDQLQESQKTELQKAVERADKLQQQMDKMIAADKVRRVRDKVSAETGVPAGLLSGDDEETCLAQAKGIIEFAKPSGYPKIKDAGEARPQGTGGKTRDQFAEWFSENLHK